MELLTKGYSELHEVKHGLKSSLSPSIYEQLQLGGRTGDTGDSFFTMDEFYEMDDDEAPTENNPFYHTYRIEPGLKPDKKKAVPKPAEGEEGAKPKQEKFPKWNQRGGYSLKRKFSSTTYDPEYQYQLRLDRFKRKMLYKSKGDLDAQGLRHPVLNMTKVRLRNR